MEFTTLDVATAEGHTLKVGVCANGRAETCVLIVPGLYSHMGWYRTLGEALAEKGAAVFLLDRRGSGISQGLAGHMDSWRQLVDDILRVVAKIRELHPHASVCALGISLGAAMTLATSLVSGDSFQRQALLSPGLAPGLHLPLRRRVGIAYRAFARPRVLYELPFTVDQLSDDEVLRQALWDDPLRTRTITSRFLLEVFRMQRFVRMHIGRLRPPLLALVAGADTMVDNEVVLRILGTSATARAPRRIEVFEGARHVLPASVPLADLVERMWHWFTAPEASLAGDGVVRRIPLAAIAATAATAGGGA